MEKIVDPRYCMSSWLMFRTIMDSNKCFAKGHDGFHVKPPQNRILIYNSNDLLNALEEQVKTHCKGKPVALALSGGIDSAILAKMVPKGSVAYTFKCVVPGIHVVDESPVAAKYAAECGLEHRIVEITWDDMQQLSKSLMLHKGQPVHSIEIQIYKACLLAQSDGFDKMIFGESADAIYGGMSGLLSQDWNFGEFVDRYSYVLPYKVLKDFVLITEPYKEFVKDGYVDVHAFMNHVFYEESTNSYYNSCAVAGMECVMPFANTILATQLDYERVRKGENKYLVREVFDKLYPGWDIPAKIPMPRPLNEWMREWEGPVRPEFWPHCTDKMTGDQKWYVWSLEYFLNLIA